LKSKRGWRSGRERGIKTEKQKGEREEEGK